MMLTACSDSFLENKPQGALSEGNMDDPDAVNLLINSAYATFGCRYADLLLYKAEALIEIGGNGLEEARNIINRIRTRAMNSSWRKSISTISCPVFLILQVRYR